MSLQAKIKEEVKDAMRAKDAVRLDVLRGMLSAFTNDLVAKGRKPQEELTDEEALAVISRLSKQRKDSIDQFQKGGREDLVAEESAQLAIIETYLPTQMTREEVEIFVKEKIASSGPIEASKKGMFVGMIMKELKGKADGNVVKESIDALIN